LHTVRQYGAVGGSLGCCGLTSALDDIHRADRLNPKTGGLSTCRDLLSHGDQRPAASQHAGTHEPSGRPTRCSAEIAQHQIVHSYRPNSDTMRDSCLADVDTCDVCVLIVGHGYGF